MVAMVAKGKGQFGQKRWIETTMPVRGEILNCKVRVCAGAPARDPIVDEAFRVFCAEMCAGLYGQRAREIGNAGTLERRPKTEDRGRRVRGGFSAVQSTG